jgi:hypothetical protein
MFQDILSLITRAAAERCDDLAVKRRATVPNFVAQPLAETYG